MGWSMTKPKRKKKSKEPFPSQEFQHVKGPRRTALIEARKEKGLTQTKLAKLIDCSTSLISAIESGRINPGVEVSMQLEMVLEKTFFELFPDL